MKTCHEIFVGILDWETGIVSEVRGHLDIRVADDEKARQIARIYEEAEARAFDVLDPPKAKARPIPIQQCRYCGHYNAKSDGSIPVECPTCYRLHWAIDTTKRDGQCQQW